MHEFGVTESIIQQLLAQLQREKVTSVKRVSFRRSSAFSEEVLRQTFKVLSGDTPLANAELIVDVAVLKITCPCGYESVINSEDLVGHMFVCPKCGAVREIAEAHDLELIEVIAENEGSLDGIQA
jgi:Zn finger protein HypA/HybF involved in hydrogenase expression